MTSIASVTPNELADTHHIRLKCAAELFHDLCRRHEPQIAGNLTCDILKISDDGLRQALENDHLAELKRAYRDLQILKARASGIAPKAIARMNGLSRVQVWRVIKELESSLEVAKALGKRKIRGKSRLTYDQHPPQKTPRRNAKLIEKRPDA